MGTVEPGKDADHREATVEDHGHREEGFGERKTGSTRLLKTDVAKSFQSDAERSTSFDDETMMSTCAAFGVD